MSEIDRANILNKADGRICGQIVVKKDKYFQSTANAMSVFYVADSSDQSTTAENATYGFRAQYYLMERGNR